MITASNSNSLNLYLLKIKNKNDVFEIEGIYSSEERMIAALKNNWELNLAVAKENVAFYEQCLQKLEENKFDQLENLFEVERMLLDE